MISSIASHAEAAGSKCTPFDESKRKQTVQRPAPHLMKASGKKAVHRPAACQAVWAVGQQKGTALA